MNVTLNGQKHRVETFDAGVIAAEGGKVTRLSNSKGKAYRTEINGRAFVVVDEDETADSRSLAG